MGSFFCSLFFFSGKIRVVSCGFCRDTLPAYLSAEAMDMDSATGAGFSEYRIPLIASSTL